MKKMFLIISICSSTISFAQTGTNLSKGKQVSITTTTTQNIDLGMQMNSNSTMVNKVAVADVNAKNYILTNTMTKFIFSGDMMGKVTSFDSDKKEDRESEEGKQFGAMLDKTDTVKIDVKTGIAVEEKDANTSAAENENPMAGMMGAMGSGNNDAIASSIIFKIPIAVKAGSTWTDSSTVDKMKSIMTYTIETLTNDIASIKSKGSVAGTSTMEMQGNSFDMTMDTKSEGTILVDVKTNLVKKRTNIADVNGSIEMMGQSMPFTSKTTIESIYE